MQTMHLARQKNNKAYSCDKINDADCKWLRLSADQCKKARSAESWKDSKRYVGKGFRKVEGGDYTLYSFPAATECHAGKALGDGGCTWKRQNFFRMIKGHKGITIEEMRKAFQSAPLQSKSCGGSGILTDHDVGVEELMV